jgi:hypothetical protein
MMEDSLPMLERGVQSFLFAHQPQVADVPQPLQSLDKQLKVGVFKFVLVPEALEKNPHA